MQITIYHILTRIIVDRSGQYICPPIRTSGPRCVPEIAKIDMMGLYGARTGRSVMTGTNERCRVDNSSLRQISKRLPPLNMGYARRLKIAAISTGLISDIHTEFG